jgi:methionine--tRNA ligase beta chain
MSDKPQPAPNAPASAITFDDFARVHLRVATVLAAEPHPQADRLLVLQVDLGTERRQIVAGIRGYYEPAALVGRQIVVVANLAPRTMRGQESQGMLLAASTPDRSDVVLLAPDRPVPPGSVVS